MKKMRNANRLFVVPIIAAFILGLIFMPAVLPMVKMHPKQLPIGLVVDDEGEMGTKLADALQTNAPELVNFTSFDTVDDMKAAMDEREVYGGFVVPADFSNKVMTLQTDDPEKATVQLYINEGANPQAATIVQTALMNIVTMLNAQLSTQMLMAVQEKVETMKKQLAPVLQAQGANSPFAQMGEMLSPIPPSKVQDFANPIQSEVIKVHETGNLSNAPIAYLMITWFTSLIGAVVLYVVGNNRSFASKTDKWKFHALQSIMPFVYALVVGYVATWYSTWILDFELEHFNRVALYLAICVAAFILMIFTTLRWLKFPSIIIFIILMFFSMSAVQLPPEMMPAFYRDYIISWLPIRIYADGLREVLFFSKDLINHYSVILIWIMVIALVLLWVKNIVEKPKATES